MGLCKRHHKSFQTENNHIQCLITVKFWDVRWLQCHNIWGRHSTKNFPLEDMWQNGSPIWHGPTDRERDKCFYAAVLLAVVLVHIELADRPTDGTFFFLLPCETGGCGKRIEKFGFIPRLPFSSNLMVPKKTAVAAVEHEQGMLFTKRNIVIIQKLDKGRWCEENCAQTSAIVSIYRGHPVTSQRFFLSTHRDLERGVSIE